MKNTPDPEYDKDAGYAYETGKVKLFNQHQILTWSYVLMILNTRQRCTGYQRVHRFKPNGLKKHQKKNKTKMADF